MDAAGGMVLSVAREGDEMVIGARGQLDFATNTELARTVESVADDSCSICALDFELVTFIDSEALKTLLSLHRAFAERGKTLYIRKCSAQVGRTISLLGIGLDFTCDWPNSCPGQAI